MCENLPPALVQRGMQRGKYICSIYVCVFDVVVVVVGAATYAN